MARAKMAHPKKLAIFDIDGTIFRSSLLVELVNELIAEGVFPGEAASVYGKARREWLDRAGDYDDYIGAVIAAFRKYLKGVRYRDLRRVAYRTVAEHKNRTYRYTRDLARHLRLRGYYLVAISHSPKIAVEAFAKTIGFNKVYGMMYETDRAGLEGKFTGKVLHEDIVHDKDKLAKRALDGGDLADSAGAGLTLRGSVGVGDTESDIPFLKMVSRAICFNPNAKLLRAARRHGWEVIVERKDVVYEGV